MNLGYLAEGFGISSLPKKSQNKSNSRKISSIKNKTQIISSKD